MHVVLTLYNSKTFLVYWSGFPLPWKPMFMWILIWSIIYIWWRNSWRTTIQQGLPLTWSYIFIIYRWAINFFCMIALWFQSCTGSIGIGLYSQSFAETLINAALANLVAPSCTQTSSLTMSSMTFIKEMWAPGGVGGGGMGTLDFKWQGCLDDFFWVWNFRFRDHSFWIGKFGKYFLVGLI